jgi:hypothetical protein
MRLLVLLALATVSSFPRGRMDDPPGRPVVLRPGERHFERFAARPHSAREGSLATPISWHPKAKLITESYDFDPPGRPGATPCAIAPDPDRRRFASRVPIPAHRSVPPLRC